MKRSSLKGKLLFENLVHSSTRARKKSFIINRFSPLLLGISYSHARIRLYRAYPTECNVHVHEREKNYNFVARSFPFPFSLPSPPPFANTDFILRGWYANETELMVACLSAGDEEWDDGNEQNVLEVTEQDNEATGIKRECC